MEEPATHVTVETVPTHLGTVVPSPVPPPAPTTPPAPKSRARADAHKHGWSTSEHWLTVLAIVASAVIASGVLTNDTAVRIVTIIATVLASLGYTGARTAIKRGQQ